MAEARDRAKARDGDRQAEAVKSALFWGRRMRLLLCLQLSLSASTPSAAKCVSEQGLADVLAWCACERLGASRRAFGMQKAAPEYLPSLNSQSKKGMLAALQALPEYTSLIVEAKKEVADTASRTTAASSASTGKVNVRGIEECLAEAGISDKNAADYLTRRAKKLGEDDFQVLTSFLAVKTDYKVDEVRAEIEFRVSGFRV